ncbi:hypothetical protein TI39_contig803g00005 [Zymoseptoria brevis]|uniref:Uncharacterized protein n=1 Tax=Zymoseptoria brevis TaxID=1047168 RepID=A0A0F4GGL5_9PEZI|nr:hypothetical protein TI39_contig803g00005 [Zymoseptoria brevis]
MAVEPPVPPKAADGNNVDLTQAGWTPAADLTHIQEYSTANLFYIYPHLSKVGKGAPTQLKSLVIQNVSMFPTHELEYNGKAKSKEVNAGAGGSLTVLFGQVSAGRIVHAAKCEHCGKGNGKFSECVTANDDNGVPWADGACMNCMLCGSAAKCSKSTSTLRRVHDTLMAATAPSLMDSTPTAIPPTGHHLRIPISATSNVDTIEGLRSLQGDIVAYQGAFLTTIARLDDDGIKALNNHEFFGIRDDAKKQAIEGNKGGKDDSGATRGKKRRRERDEDDSEEDRKPSMVEMAEGFRRMEKKITKLQEEMAAMRG